MLYRSLLASVWVVSTDAFHLGAGAAAGAARSGGVTMADLSIESCGMKFPNPFVIGSGPPGTNYKVASRTPWLGRVLLPFLSRASRRRAVARRLRARRRLAARPRR